MCIIVFMLLLGETVTSAFDNCYEKYNISNITCLNRILFFSGRVWLIDNDMFIINGHMKNVNMTEMCNGLIDHRLSNVYIYICSISIVFSTFVITEVSHVSMYIYIYIYIYNKVVNVTL